VTEPTVVHDTPSAERDAVITLPARASRTHVGVNAPAVPLTVADDPPVVALEINCTPCVAVVANATCFELAASDSRISTPAFAQPFVFWMPVTRATIEPSPVSLCHAKRNESAVPPTAVPPPATVKVPPPKPASPRAPTAPTSADAQPVGRSLTDRSYVPRSP